MKKTTSAGSTFFVYDEAGHLIGEYDGSGAAIQEIVWLGDIPVATIRLEACGLSIFYIHTDHLNAPRRITRRSTSDVVWSWDGDPFGAAAPNENPSGLGTFSFNMRLPGQYYAETGLSYNMARDYDPSVGRYVESDPIGLRGGIDTYAYAKNRPDMLIDASGLFTLSESDVTYHYVKRVPNGDEHVGGGTNPSLSVQCECTGCSGKWQLKVCHGELLIDVALLDGVSNSAERDFYRKSEGDHVRDLQFGAGRLLAAGQRAESSLRGEPFKSQQECQNRSAAYVVGEMQPVLQQMWNESHAKWDGMFGPHSWWSFSKWLGF